MQQTQRQISATAQRSQVQTKVVSGLRCPDCHANAVSVKLVRGSIVAGSAKCQSCGWSVRVAQFTDGIVGKCPCCSARTWTLTMVATVNAKANKSSVKATNGLTSALMAFLRLTRRRWWLTIVATNQFVLSAVNAIVKLKPNTLALAKLSS